ncbi:hypothetical protein C8R47DRAFT_1064399 [Mycena vitilis]|nr:hypothetical protein C8R47DRAFT_1064399 [Mycena vitilis]
MNHTIDSDIFEEGWDFAMARTIGLRIEGKLWSSEAAQTYRGIFLAKDLDLLFVTNSLVTDSFFIYRCFIIWGRSIRVVVGPLLMLLGSASTNSPPAILGYLAIYEDISDSVSAYHIYTPAAVAMGLATNLVVMGLTVSRIQAGRIWWIRRDASVLESARGVDMIRECRMSSPSVTFNFNLCIESPGVFSMFASNHPRPAMHKQHEKGRASP